MHLLQSLTRPLFRVHPGERKKTLLMFIFFFLTISMIYMLKPVRSALFLEEFGAEKLPYIYIGEGLWLIIVVWAYTQVSKRFSKMTIYLGVLAFMMLNLLALWVLLGRTMEYLSAFFYIWVASFSITMTTLFWTLANDIFDPMEAKRLFGIIISGGSLGGILGGVLTHEAVDHVQAEDMLLIAAFVLVLCTMLVFFLRGEIRGVDRARKLAADAKPAEAKMPRKKTLKVLRGSSYLMMLAAIVIIAKVSSTVVDAQFNKIVEVSVTGTEARTAYFGAFWAWLNGISFCMQLFVTSLLLRFFGVGFSLWLLPAGLAILTVATVIHPVLWVAQILRIFDGSTNYSIQLASKETLYLPLSSALRHKVKPIIDMLGFRSAKAIGGILILAAASWGRIPYERIGVIVLFIVPVWAFIAWQMKGAYSKLLRSHLLNRRQYERSMKTRSATEVLGFLHDEKGFEEVKDFMNHRSSYARKLAAAAVYTYDRTSRDLKTTQRIMNQIVRHETPEGEKQQDGQKTGFDAGFLEKLFHDRSDDLGREDVSVRELMEGSVDEVLMRISELLRDSEETLEAKRDAVRILEYLPRQETADLLLHRLAGRQEHALRFLMAKALNRIRKKNQKLIINRFLVKSEIARELTIHDQIIRIRSFYLAHRKPLQSDQDYVEIALCALLDENLERVFQYLKLLYPGEAMTTIYEEIISSRNEGSHKAHAIELLSNTLEPDLHIMMQRVIDDHVPTRWNDREMKNTLKSFAKSPDHWFSLIGHFLIADLKLDERWPELGEYRDVGNHPFFVS